MVCERSGHNKVPRTREQGRRTAKRAVVSGLPNGCGRPKSESEQGRDITGFTRQAVHGSDTQIHEEGII